MFVIAIYQSIVEYRDHRLNQLMDEVQYSPKKWIRKDGKKFYETNNLSWCEYWKTSTAPTKIVNDWNKLVNKRDYRGKFSSVWGNYLVV